LFVPNDLNPMVFLIPRVSAALHLITGINLLDTNSVLRLILVTGCYEGVDEHVRRMNVALANVYSTVLIAEALNR